MQQINKHLFCASRCFHCLPLWSVSSLCQPPKYRDRLDDRGKKTYTHTHHLSLGSVIHSVMDLLYFCANFACRVFCFFYVDICILRSKKNTSSFLRVFFDVHFTVETDARAEFLTFICHLYWCDARENRYTENRLVCEMGDISSSSVS